MHDHTVSFVGHDLKAKTKVARPAHDALIFDGEVRLLDADTGSVVAVQARLPGIYTELRHQLQHDVAYWDGTIPGRKAQVGEARMSGISYQHRTFGFADRKPLRQRPACSASVLAWAQPEIHQHIDRLNDEAAALFARWAPDEYAIHMALVDRPPPEGIAPCWRIGGGPWTSGIINATASLPYHRDGNNLTGCWSAMPVLRRRTSGGLLHVPDYDVYLTAPDSHVLIFDGARRLHGVTPMRARAAKTGTPYRYSLVFYAVQGMRSCASPAEEAKVAARLASERDRHHDFDDPPEDV